MNWFRIILIGIYIGVPVGILLTRVHNRPLQYKEVVLVRTLQPTSQITCYLSGDNQHISVPVDSLRVPGLAGFITGANHYINKDSVVTIIVPPNHTYQVIFDGKNRAVLNQFSTISFSLLKKQKDRVRVTGEVYFRLEEKRDTPYFIIECDMLTIRSSGGILVVNSVKQNEHFIAAVRGDIYVDDKGGARFKGDAHTIFKRHEDGYWGYEDIDSHMAPVWAID